MVKDRSQTQSELVEHKIEILDRVYKNLFIILLVGGILAAFFSTYSVKEKITGIIFFGIVFSVMFIITNIVRKYASSLIKMRAYFILSVSTYLIIAFSTSSKSLANTAAPLMVVFFTIFFIQNIRYLITISVIATLLNIAFMVYNPTPTVTLGIGYFLAYIFSVYVTLSLSIRGIQLLKWYEDKLKDEISNANEQNLELTALNEEYYAAQEELYHNYDEIVKLNKNESLLNEKLDALLSVTEDGIIDYNITDDTYYFTSNAMMHLGITAFDTFESILERIDPEDQDLFKSAWQSIVNGNNSEISIFVKYDHIQDYNFTFIHYTDREDKTYLIAAIKDVSLIKAHEKNIFQLAYRDNLTGLYNRAGFIESIDYVIATEKDDFIIALIDIDNFKAINNIFGYNVGDSILVTIAASLKNEPLEYSTRIGDDKFAFLIRDEKNLNPLLNAITQNQEIHINDQLHLNIKLSIGLAKFEDGLTTNELVKRAEIATFHNKQNSNTPYSYYNHIYVDQIEKRLLLSNGLERALSLNEIYMVYQPKYDVLTKKIVSFEALARWESKKFGFVPPDIFIDIAEQSGYIKPLSQFIIYESCLFAKKINANREGYLISINISGKQLLDPDFSESFLKILSDMNLDPCFVGIEITETAIVENLELAISELQKLHAAGITLYLDDFGTGYSSLNYLARMPIDILKIDKSFIDGLHNQSNSKLVLSIIQLAKSMGIKTVAEGVEFEDQFEMMKGFGCDIIQGYYFDKPLLAEEAQKRINGNFE